MRRRAMGTEGRLALLQGCLGGAGFVAETLGEVLVISMLGAAWMPIGLAGAALLSLGLTAGLSRRQPGPRRLIGLAGAAVAAGIAIWIGLLLIPALAALAFLLLGRPLRDALLVTFGNLVAPRYDPQVAKRALPRLAAAGQGGAILAGLALPVLLQIGGTRAAVAVWPLLAGVALALAWRFPLVLAANGATKAPVQPTTLFPRHSPFLWTLGGAAMLAVTGAGALGLTAAMHLSQAIPDQANLASVYALAGVAGSIGILAVQLAGLPWLISRFGTARTAIIPPTLAFMVAGWAVFGGGIGAGMAAQLGRLTLRPSLQTPIEEILLGLLPASERVAGRAWLRAGAVPLAGLVSGIGLAALASAGANVTIIAGLALLAAFGGIIIALALRRQHRRATLALAQSDDALAQRLALPTLGGVDAAVRGEITRRLAASEHESEQELLVALLADLDPATATTSVVALLPGASPRLTAALLMILAERSCSSGALLPAAPELLTAPEADVRRATLAALATAPPQALALIRPLLDDTDPAVALAAIERLTGHSTPEDQLARERLRSLAGSDRAAVREAAAPLAARLAPDLLAPLLGDPVVAIRRAAASAAGSLARPPEVVNKALLLAASDDASAVRAAAVAALAHYRAATPTLVAALDDLAPAVRAAGARALLDASGDHAYDLAQQLPSGHNWARTMVLAILARRSPRRWRSALLTEEGAGLALLARLAATRQALGPPVGPAGALLRRDFDDTLADGMSRWGECVGITDGTGTSRIIRQGLASQEPRVRAGAQEALEAVRSPALARIAAGLLAPRATEDCTSAVEQRPEGGQPHRPAFDDLAIGDGRWRRMLLAAAAREEPGLPGGDGVTETPDGGDKAMLSLVERASLLRGVPPFADLPSEQLRLLAEVAEEIDIAAGETLMAAGSEGDHLYVIIVGQVALEERRGSSGSVARIATLGPGAAVGEDAVFDGGMHAVSATAVNDCRLLALGREVLLALLEEQPALARTLIAWLSARLRETSGKLAERTRVRPRSVVDLLDQIGDQRR